MPYLKHTLTTNSIHVWGEDMIGKVCLKKNKNLPLSELREALQFFYRTISSPQVMSSQELSEGSSGWSGDVQLGQWAVVINLYICFSGSKKTKLVLLLASRKKATHKGAFKSVWKRGIEQLHITSGPFSVALTGGILCMVLCRTGSISFQKPVTFWKIISFHDF